MIKFIDVKDAIYKEEKLLVDVRSPFEHSEGTIPGAINIPLFNDKERIEVGTLYKKVGVDHAKIKGIEYAATKLSVFYERLLELSKTKKDIIIFCARGGLRSSSIVSFFNNLGVEVYQLKNGYKGYRRFILEYFEELNKHHQFIVLHGYTGVGKTEILQKINKRNIAVLDIEMLARNTGSVFGNIGFIDSQTINQKNFEAIIVDTLIKSKQRTMIVESESKRIGNVSMPNSLYESIIKGKHILLKTTIENRVDRLANDYAYKIPEHDELLIESIMSLKARIGNENVLRYIEYIKNKHYEDVARELVIDYYDPLYQHSIKKYNYDLTIDYDKIEEAVDVIENFYHTIEKEIKR
ncbi:tRNA 2-selenouridine synthase [Anaerovirgula multivorans]|uniref:tRNA 2-selenouridine synthase n=1 Tax=Anaerovirgula multivorans TaxID=312168 RepID=A0A238ZZL8_9FIRM|nr:tRNA 2-selenouridine(34) synthase MnmH [Anaerovirgula multivorans]SNR88709.1 tRNA 2-selenouridine synthase [Anaerovirgula multivorans]